MNVSELSMLYDMDTRACLPTNNTLRLFGSNDSYFLNAIAKKCKSFGIKCETVSNYVGPGSMRQYPTVVDTETYHNNISLEEWQDIDCQYNDGISCVSQAVINILSQYKIAGKHIVIVGRGHAVQGMRGVLLANDATVTVCHSKTVNMYDITKLADILILATPKIDGQIDINNKDVIIDVGNALTDVSVENYINKIGKLTVSILVNRFVRCGE